MDTQSFDMMEGSSSSLKYGQRLMQKFGKPMNGAQPPDYGVFCCNEEFSDVRITVGDTTYFGHRIVLASTSEVFQTMLSSIWCTTSDLHLEETGDCEEVFPEFLEFLYTWKVKLNEENVIPLGLLADKYLVKDLASLCVDFMVAEVCSENAIPWFRFSLKYDVDALYDKCITYISHNFEHFNNSGKLVELETSELSLVLDSGAIVCKSEMDIIQAIIRWMKAYDRPVQETLRDDIVKLFGSVRAPMLSPDDIDKIEKMKELQDFVMLLLPKFYMSYKYHSFGLGVPIPPEDKKFKNYVPRIYTDRCGTTFNTTTFWEHYFQTPSHMSAKYGAILKWKYQNRKPNELDLLPSPVSALGNLVPFKLRVIRLTKRERNGFAEVKIMNDTVNLVSTYGPCIDMGVSFGYENDIKKHGLTVVILPDGFPI
ncbi:kelch-like protein 7 [Saccostrea cucullata]|uniref:kelch-like protein 7 n=1 Tax=Saccostrea cuccullata TaxID=36930 RepID=UPI002ED36BB9